MKNRITLLAAAAASLLVSACGTTSSTALAGATKPYPRNTCIVTGNELGSMGPVITQVHKGQEVKFCCKPCVKKFAANPDKYLKDL